MVDKEEKEEKPKKAFVVVHTIWDDGEIDTEMYEFRKNPSGRGAPGKWRLGAKDFKRRLEETLGDAETLADVMQENTGVFSTDIADSIAATTDTPPLKPIRPPHGHIPDPKEVKELDNGSGEEFVDNSNDSNDSDGLDNVDFGEFDKK